MTFLRLKEVKYTMEDKRFNNDGSINIEELNKAYERHFQHYDEMREMSKVIGEVLVAKRESRT